MPTLFTKIIRGELPSYAVYEDEYTFAFLALDQIRPGHTLVVPKIEAETFLELGAPHYQQMFSVVQKVGRAISTMTQCPRVGMAAQGFEVPHCHIHVVPLFATTDLDFRIAKRLPESEMSRLRDQLRAEIQALQ